MNIIGVTHLRWADPAHTRIEMIISTDIGDLPFAASADDIESHGREIFERAVSGEWGPIAEYQPPPPPPIDQVKAAAKARIDAAAGRARARYITVAPGQEATYQAKAAEADAYVAAGRPADTSAYPILTAEAQVRSIDVSQLADLVRETRDQWVQFVSVVEALRIGGKLAVDAATDHVAVEAAVAQAEAELYAV
jgi:hypothetical protein